MSIETNNLLVHCSRGADATRRACSERWAVAPNAGGADQAATGRFDVRCE
jgi:hypothetical protein